MKKLLLILTLFIIGCGIWYFITLKKASEQGATEVPSDTISQSGVYTAATNDDTYKEVKYPDPLTLAITSPDELGNVFLVREKDYMIEYFTKDKVFNITLLGSDLSGARMAAESKLLQLLSVSNEDACKLKTYVGAPYGLSQELAGSNLGLSFCPGSVDLTGYKKNTESMSSTSDTQ
jgi:hypothetical protein